jgi:hypothetical protein
MLHQTNLIGLSTTQLQALNTQILLTYFADETSEEQRDELASLKKTIDNSLPHSFVLASLFDVESMTLEIPDHMLESDPSLEWVTCPCREGEK